MPAPRRSFLQTAALAGGAADALPRTGSGVLFASPEDVAVAEEQQLVLTA